MTYLIEYYMQSPCGIITKHEIQEVGENFEDAKENLLEILTSKKKSEWRYWV